jgi:hypothetical protein
MQAGVVSESGHSRTGGPPLPETEFMGTAMTGEGDLSAARDTAILKQPINGHAPDNGEWQDPAKQFVGSISRNTH